MKKITSLRWILLGAGIIAILGLTAMNVFSLLSLHKTTIESDIENKKLQVSEFTDRVHHRFLQPFKGLGGLNIDHVEQYYNEKGMFPDKLHQLLDSAVEDSIFNGIYFNPHHSNACQQQGAIYRFDREANHLVTITEYPEQVCEGMGIARTRMKVLIDGYRYNNKVIFNTHTSVTLALVNLSTQSVFGYLTMPIDQDFLIERYLQPRLVEKFGGQSSGVIVWVRDWTKNQTIAGSVPGREYDGELVQYAQRFPDFFDNWSLRVAFTESPTVSASKASLIRNLVVLGAAFFLLLGALVFMFITAQRERALAERQAGFLANVTHELKTPLAVMQAAGENLADGRVDNEERLKAYGNHIYSEAVRLKRMIEKLLDVAKADVNRSMVDPKPVKLDILLKDYLNDHRSYIINRGFTLETEIEDDLPLANIDVDSFETIMVNLLENAIKYSTDDKFIKITLTHRDDWVNLIITDHGVGIPKKSIGQIFEKFYRVEDSLTAKTKGHGLGLSIVKNLVELNGGTINVESEENSGSRFILQFPVLAEPEIMEDRKQLEQQPSNTVSQD